MKNSKLPVIILTVLLVGCIGGSAVLYNTQTESISDLQASESQLMGEVDTLTVESADNQTMITDLNTQKQVLVDEVADLEGVVDNTNVILENTKAMLEYTEESLASELLIQEGWAVYLEPDKIIGEWIAVNFVNEENKFDPHVQSPSELWIKSLRFSAKNAFFNIGEGYRASSPWVDDHIFDDATAMGFMIQEIDGLEYLFLEWKSGDYIRDNSIDYYVFKKVG